MGRRLDGRKGTTRIVEESKAVVMPRGQDCILHAALFGELCPCICVKMFRMKLAGEFRVVANRNLLVPLHPFATTWNGIDAPMQEHSEARIAPPGDPLLGLCSGGHRRPLRTSQCATKRQN